MLESCVSNVTDAVLLVFAARLDTRLLNEGWSAPTASLARSIGAEHLYHMLGSSSASRCIGA